MKFELASLILNSPSGKIAHSTWKTILGISVGVGLILFITGKLDSFIINMEDYMLSFMPEIQFQRTKNAMPTQLKLSDSRKFSALLEGDDEILVKGPAFFQIGIFQFQSDLVHINKRSLVLSGLVADSTNTSENLKPGNPLLLDISKNIRTKGQFANILADDSKQVIISARLSKKLFGNSESMGISFKIGARQTKNSKLIEVTVGGVYVNASVNSVFMSKNIAAQLTKNNNALWANTFIVRLKDKYRSKTWRQNLIDKLALERDQAGYYVDKYEKQFETNTTPVEELGMENSGGSKDKIADAMHQQEFQRWDAKYQSAQDSLDFLKPFQIQSWMDISPENLRHLKMTRILTTVILFAVLMLTAVSIKFLFDTIVIEKRRQIATLKAIGFGNRSIMVSFLSAGLFIGVMGVIIGSLLGISLNFATAAFEARLFEEMFGIQYRNIGLSAEFVMRVGAITVILSLLSAFFPMWSTLRIQPIEGIRREG